MPVSDEAAQTLGRSELDVADQLGHQVIRFMRLMHRAKSQVAKSGPDGIERAAYMILFSLVYDGPQRTSRLADNLHVEISTISRQSSSLVQHGLIERLPDPEDGRACLLAPTSEGIRVFEENRKLRNEWLAGVLAEWPLEDRENLSELFTRLNAGIEAQLPYVNDGGHDSGQSGGQARPSSDDQSTNSTATQNTGN